MCAMCHKWLINKGILVDRVSTQGQAPYFYKAPPPCPVGAYAAYNGSLSQGRIRVFQGSPYLHNTLLFTRVFGGAGVINIPLFANTLATPGESQPVQPQRRSFNGGRGGISTGSKEKRFK